MDDHTTDPRLSLYYTVLCRSSDFLMRVFHAEGQMCGVTFAKLFASHAPPASAEELVLELAEESLGRGVVWRATHGAHGTGQPVFLAYANPFGSAVVAAMVGMVLGMLTVTKLFAGSSGFRVCRGFMVVRFVPVRFV